MKHLPNAQDDAESWGRALWLEEREFERQMGAVASGIARAFSGS